MMLMIRKQLMRVKIMDDYNGMLNRSPKELLRDYGRGKRMLPMVL